MSAKEQILLDLTNLEKEILDYVADNLMPDKALFSLSTIDHRMIAIGRAFIIDGFNHLKDTLDIEDKLNS